MLTYKAISSSVIGKDGMSHRIDQSLVKKPTQPQGGWKVVLTINGEETLVPGADANSVFNEARRLLNLNGVKVSDLDLWANLNIQWLGKSPEKYQKVRLSDLMTGIAGAGDPAPARATPHKAYIGPAIWGSKGWAPLQMALAMDTYEYGEFLALASTVAKWIDPTLNPSRGCSECFVHFTQALADLRLKPRYTQEEARRWLWQTMNGANQRKGSPVLTFEDASQRNHWT